jgi:hypothetical protein
VTGSPLGARTIRAVAALALAAGALSLAPGAACASEGFEGATWHLEQPPPPPPAPGVAGSSTPIGLGPIGDMEFIAPNRGLLITAGDGTTVPPGVWAYDGAGWKELANVCGATDGRIAWAGEDEFWTVSDARPGQAREEESGKEPPLEDNTLCHFVRPVPQDGQNDPFEVAASYASIAFRTSSYEAMHAAGCLAPDDCWFAGAPLPSGSAVSGSFHLHWTGSALLEEPFEGEAQSVEDMRAFEGRLYESVQITKAARLPEVREPPVLHAINPAGVSPTFESIPGSRGVLESPHVPLYGPHEFLEALGALHLAADEEELWAATGPAHREEAPNEQGQVTVVRYSPAQGEWRQLLGASTHPSGEALFPNELVTSIAVEPGGGGAWVALESLHEAENSVSPEAFATVAHISPEGVVSAVETLPSQDEREHGVGEKGSAARIACPAARDCWLSTTGGWLFHLTTGEAALPVDDEGFSSLIANRPADLGLPQVPPDAPPEESTTGGELTPAVTFTEAATPLSETRVTQPLLTKLKSRLLHGDRLELSFRLAVEARVRLVAERHGVTVASTPTRTLAAGERALQLRLNPHRWPTKLDLQTHALAPLPTVAARSPSVDTISTSLASPKTLGPTPGSLF